MAGSDSSIWTKKEDKAFENALAIYDVDSADGWEKIAATVPGKSLEEVKHHYQLLVEDINMIESGAIPLPNYPDNHVQETRHVDQGEKTRRKGQEWTKNEHKLFPFGLKNHGKGNGKTISRKYYMRKNSKSGKNKRPLIHDITIVEPGEVVAASGVGSNNITVDEPRAFDSVPSDHGQIGGCTNNVAQSEALVAAAAVPEVGSHDTTSIEQVSDGPLAFDRSCTSPSEATSEL